MATEVYQPVWSLSVPGRQLEEIQGETITNQTTPFAVGVIPAFSLVSMGTIKSLKDGTQLTNSRLVQISSHHGRSFEVTFGQSPALIWADEYGNYYSTLTTKGNYLANPHVARSNVEPSGFAVYGMQDTDALVRILRVSRLLRANQIGTECYIRVIEPQALPFKGSMVSLEEFRSGLIKQVWDRREGASVGMTRLGFGEPISRADIPRYSEHLDNSTFVITVRGMQVAERLQDLERPTTKEEFIEMMSRVFKYVNLTERLHQQENGSQWIDLDPEKDEDLTRYFQEYLPQKIGNNYGKLHNLGLVHVFAHQGNISAVGSIYDLDSAKGEAIGCGDAKVTNNEFRSELDKVLKETEQTLSNLAAKDFVHFPFRFKVFKENLLDTYFNNRSNVLAVVKDIIEGYEHFYGLEDTPKLIEYSERIVQELGWDYTHQETIEQLTATFDQEDEINVIGRIERVLKNPGEEISVEKLLERVLGDAGAVDEEYSSEHAIDRFAGTWLDERVKRVLSQNRSEELAKVANQYGQEAAEAVIDLLTTRELRKLADQRTEEMDEGIQKRGQERVARLRNHYLQNAKDFYIQLFRDPPADFDPLGRIKLITNIFNYFDWSADDEEARDLYLHSLTKEIGWDYQHREGYDQVAQSYNQALGFYTRAFFVKEWGKNPDPDSFGETFNKAINLTVNCKALESIYLFIRDRIEEAVRTLYRDEVKELTEKYGKDNVDELLLLISYREADSIIAQGGKDDASLAADMDSVFENIKVEFTKQLAIKSKVTS